MPSNKDEVEDIEDKRSVSSSPKTKKEEAEKDEPESKIKILDLTK